MHELPQALPFRQILQHLRGGGLAAGCGVVDCVAGAATGGELVVEGLSSCMGLFGSRASDPTEGLCPAAAADDA